MTIEERIERLERTNRRYRLMFTLLGLIAVCIVGVSATQDDKVPDVIQAKAFEVVDDEGTKFVEIRRNPVFIGKGYDGGLIRLNTKSAKDLVLIRSLNNSDSEGQGIIQIQKSEEKAYRLSLGSNGFSVYNKQERQNVPIAMFVHDGAGWMSLSKDRQRFIELTNTPTGGSVIVTNKTGEDVCTLAVDEYGNGQIGAWNRKGKGHTLQPGP